MPSQIKIINAVNYCLKQKSNIDFELNTEGVCAGLAGLYIKYALENKSKQFFDILEQLSHLPKDYNIGTNPSLDSFIMQIEKVYDPAKYSSYELKQGDLDKILDINNKPIKNEFNLGLITDEDRWETILNSLSMENRGYFVTSNNHAIALIYKNGTYIIYDPNYNKTTKEFSTAQSVISELKECFDYSTELLGLSIRAFAHPDEAPVLYPEPSLFHQLAFQNDTDKARTLITDKTYQSSLFATSAHDIETISYLFKENAFVWDLLITEFLSPDFNNLLIAQSLSPDLQKAILKSIQINIASGKIATVKQLIDRYNFLFPSEALQIDLKTTLHATCSTLVRDQLGMMNQTKNYSYLLDLFEQFKFNTDLKTKTIYNHLKLLTYLSEEASEEPLMNFLKTLTPEQLIEQIKTAAFLNQQTLLTQLIKSLLKSKIEPQKYPNIFSEELINHVNPGTLKKLLNAGFTADLKKSNLLYLCSMRKDKSIFEDYARSFSEQEQSGLWINIDKYIYESLNLESKIGPITLLNALIFLKKNEHIRKSWQDSIGIETIKEALTTAVANGSVDISHFLKTKLDTKNAALELDTIEFLIQKALDDQNIHILNNLAQLTYNVIPNLALVKKVLSLCQDYHDFSAIERSFDLFSAPIKKMIFEGCIQSGYLSGYNLCIRKEPQLLSVVLNPWIKNPNEADPYNVLIKINSKISSLPLDVLRIEHSEEEQKAFIHYCMHHNLFHLAHTLSATIKLNDAELDFLFTSLVKSKNEKGLIELFKIYPDLGRNSAYFQILIQNNYLKVIEHLIKEKVAIDESLYTQLFIDAIKTNNKNLIQLLINQGKITPQTPFNPPLSELLNTAVKEGNDLSLEPFVTTTLNFNLDFKALFIWSCDCVKPQIANQLLAQSIHLNDEEIKSAFIKLFGNISSEALYETLYQQALGRLYELLLKTNIQNPRAELMGAIREPDKDSKFIKTQLYWDQVKRAIKEDSKEKFHALFNESTLPKQPDMSILAVLNDPFLSPKIITFFETRYTLETILSFALSQGEWIAVANIIERHNLSTLPAELQQQLLSHKDQIVTCFIKNLEDHYDKGDIRPRLFKLLQTKASALSTLASTHYEVIHHSLKQIELKMIQNKMELNNQYYRFTFSNQDFEAARTKLNEVFERCLTTIKSQNIDLNAPIEHSDVIQDVMQIKALMAKEGITPYYLKEEHENLFASLIGNPRFKSVCEYEIELYSLINEYNLDQKSLTDLPERNQRTFNAAIEGLYKSLKKHQLSRNFVLPEIQPYFNLCDQKVTSQNGINHYLNHRNETLSYMSWIFDYERGESRALHYKNLIESAKTPEELQIIHYAILVNPNGIHLKNNIVTALGYEDLNAAKNALKNSILKSRLRKNCSVIDQLIESLNQKINDNDSTSTETQFSDELNCLNELCSTQSAHAQLSFFQPKFRQRSVSWSEWFSNLFFSKPIEEDRLLPRSPE